MSANGCSSVSPVMHGDVSGMYPAPRPKSAGIATPQRKKRFQWMDGVDYMSDTSFPHRSAVIATELYS